LIIVSHHPHTSYNVFISPLPFVLPAIPSVIPGGDRFMTSPLCVYRCFESAEGVAHLCLQPEHVLRISAKSGIGVPELLDAVVATTSIALENGRLRAELRARLSELQESRGRVLEAWQTARRTIAVFVAPFLSTSHKCLFHKGF
jgi:hypothetical protein